MKLFIFMVVLAIAGLAVSMSSPKNITDEDLAAYIAEYSELYDYSDWMISDRVDTEYRDYTEIEFSFRCERRAKTHIAMIKGIYTPVDNTFVNNCFDHSGAIEGCAFITEIGTVESVESDHISVIVDRWGILSRDNLQKGLLSKETFHFLDRLLD